MARRKKPLRAEFVRATNDATEYLVSGQGIPGYYRAVYDHRTGTIDLFTGARRQPVKVTQANKIRHHVSVAISEARR